MRMMRIFNKEKLKTEYKSLSQYLAEYREFLQDIRVIKATFRQSKTKEGIFHGNAWIFDE